MTLQRTNTSALAGFADQSQRKTTRYADEMIGRAFATLSGAGYDIARIPAVGGAR